MMHAGVTLCPIMHAVFSLVAALPGTNSWVPAPPLTLRYGSIFELDLTLWYELWAVAMMTSERSTGSVSCTDEIMMVI